MTGFTPSYKFRELEFSFYVLIFDYFVYGYSQYIVSN